MSLVQKLVGYDANEGDEEELGSSVVDGKDVATPGGRSDIIKAFPGPESPLIYKIVPQKRSNGKLEGYLAITSHNHLVGDGDPKNSKNFRSHLCQKTSGQPDCPECDGFWDLFNKMKALEKAGNKGSAEYNRYKTQADLIKPKDTGWMLVVLPGQPDVKAIRASKDVLNKLFGKKATAYKPAIESLVTKMLADGNDPYNLKSNIGWIGTYKEGEKMGTTYTVYDAKMKVEAEVGGRKMTVEVPFEAKVHENILKLKRSDLPNLAKFEEKNAWKKEDSAYMAANFRAPDHILEAAANGASYGEEDENPLESGSSLADIPAADSLPSMPSNPAQVNANADLNSIDNLL